MFPPVDDAVLQANPLFAKLHRSLTTTILHPDGSTITDASPLHPALDDYLYRTSTRLLLEDALRLCMPSEPHDGHAVVLLSEAVMQRAEQAGLDALVAQLAPTVAAVLHADAVALAQVAFVRGGPAALAGGAAAMVAEVAAQRVALAEEQVAVAVLASAVVAAHRRVAALLVRVLESQHGLPERSAILRTAAAALRVRAAHTDVVADCAQVRRQLYHGAGGRALHRYADHLAGYSAVLIHDLHLLRARLAGYGVNTAGSGDRPAVMRELGSQYSTLEREADGVRADLSRLQLQDPTSD